MKTKVKRLIDIFLSLSALILLVPVFITVSLSVLIFLGRPIFFFQIRPGLNGELFKLVKFRSMKNISKQSDALRLTKFGRILRSTSLDELPELYNVLKGDMSLVGPRPLLPEYLELYSERQMQRHKVKPGITGWAQINGRNLLTWEERFDLDLWYVNNFSLFLDFKILLITIKKVLFRDGISAQGEATMNEFTGNKK
tara:strand:+ start:285 stop:875 length:591 start_codon:yes stop_codon:yes gene_type:complete